MFISSNPSHRDGRLRKDIFLTTNLPDLTPANVFDDYRKIRNSFGISYQFDAKTRAGTSVDIPLLRTSLLNFVDTTLQNRIIGGES